MQIQNTWFSPQIFYIHFLSKQMHTLLTVMSAYLADRFRWIRAVLLWNLASSWSTSCSSRVETVVWDYRESAFSMVIRDSWLKLVGRLSSESTGANSVLNTFNCHSLAFEILLCVFDVLKLLGLTFDLVDLFLDSILLEAFNNHFWCVPFKICSQILKKLHIFDKIGFEVDLSSILKFSITLLNFDSGWLLFHEIFLLLESSQLFHNNSCSVFFLQIFYFPSDGFIFAHQKSSYMHLYQNCCIYLSKPKRFLLLK